MKKLLNCVALGAFVSLVAASASLYAQSERENSIFTVTEPVDVGAFTLPPGTYLIKVLLLESNRNTIQVTNVEQTKVFANVLATPHVVRADEASPNSRYIYYATAPGQRRALRTWFARDTTNGQDIVYPRKRAMELAAAAKESVPAVPDEVKESDYKTTTLTVVTPEQQVKPYEEPAPPVMIAESRPAAAQVPATAPQLPATASHVPLLAALGLVSLGGAFGLRALVNRSA